MRANILHRGGVVKKPSLCKGGWQPQADGRIVNYNPYCIILDSSLTLRMTFELPPMLAGEGDRLRWRGCYSAILNAYFEILRSAQNDTKTVTLSEAKGLVAIWIFP